MTERPLTVPRYNIDQNGDLQPHCEGRIVLWDEMQTAVDLALRQDLQRHQDQVFRQFFYPNEAKA